MIPSRIKNAALTELPMIPPMVLKLSNREEMAAAVAATTIEVMITILAADQFTYKNTGAYGLTSSGLVRRTSPP